MITITSTVERVTIYFVFMKLAKDILGELVEQVQHVCVLYPVNNTVINWGPRRIRSLFTGRVEEVYFINILFP